MSAVTMDLDIRLLDRGFQEMGGIIGGRIGLSETLHDLHTDTKALERDFSGQGIGRFDVEEVYDDCWEHHGDTGNGQ